MEAQKQQRKPRFQLKWLELEDKTLSDLVKASRMPKWNKIAMKLNSNLYGFQSMRNSKQCKARWIEKLQFIDNISEDRDRRLEIFEEIYSMDPLPKGHPL